MTWVWYHISRDTKLPRILEISPDPPLEPSSKGSPQRHFFQSLDPGVAPLTTQDIVTPTYPLSQVIGNPEMN